MTTLDEYQQLVLDTDPWLYWPMDDGYPSTTLRDASGNSRIGYVESIAYWSHNAFPSMNSITSIYPLQAPGFHGWAVFPSTGTQDFSFSLFTDSAAGTTTNLRWGIYFLISGSVKYSLSCVSDGLNPNLIYKYNDSNSVTTSTAMTTGATQLVTFVRRSGTDYVYVDAAEAFTVSSPSFSGDFDYVSEASGGANGRARVGNFAFWDRALTTGEISSLNTRVTLLDASRVTVAPDTTAYHIREFEPFPYEPVLITSSTAPKVGLGGSITALTTLGLEPNRLGGTLTASAEPSGTLSINVIVEFIQGTTSATVDLEGTLTVQNVGGVDLESSIDFDVALESTISEVNYLEGSIDFDVSMEATVGVYTIHWAEATTAALTISAVVTDPSLFTYLSPNHTLISIDFDLGHSLFSPPPVPQPPTRTHVDPPEPGAPEAAEEADPTLNTFITIRPLMGIIVDMDTPTIVDGKPI